MAKIPKELEIEICNLPDIEKNKLLLKLIAKNDVLIDQLYFQLLGSETILKAEKEEIKKLITKVAKMIHDTPGWMMMSMRELNGKITYFVKKTKDKHGEIELTLHLLNSFFDNQPNLLAYSSYRTETIEVYLIKRTQFVLEKLKKIHEDYHIEFEDDVNKLLKHIYNSCTVNEAKIQQIPKRF